MRQKLNITLAILALVAFVIVVFALPPDPMASEFENRAMQAFPPFSPGSVVRGEFFPDLESYLLDNTSFRTSFLTFSSIADNSFGISPSGGGMMVDFGSDDLGIGLTPLDDILLANVPTAVARTEAVYSGAYIYSSAYDEAPPPIAHDLRIGLVTPPTPFSVDRLFNDNAVFYLRYIQNTDLATRYAEVLNAHAAAIPESRGDVRLFSMLAPVKVEFMGARYSAVNSPQIETIQHVNSLLDPNFITVDAHTALAENADAYTFFRLDHHWTALGAYFAYLEFARAAGFEPIGIENYVEYAIEGFVGSLAVGTRNRTILAHPDTIYFYRLADGTTFSVDMFAIPADLADACYRIFLGGDRAFLHFTSSNANGRTLMVVKDSFANALVPWLAPHYENIVKIDPRQFTGSVQDVLAGFENVDLLFINYMPATTMADLIEQIYGVR